jgi:His/Glu/Gln/Arg/opine family amino acid ABC transporter permease subunit
MKSRDVKTGSGTGAAAVFRGILFLVSLLLFSVCLSGAGVRTAEVFAEETTRSAALTDDEKAIAALAGKRMGVMTGSTFDKYTNKAISNPVISYYESYVDMALAVNQNKIDGFMMDEPAARVLLKNQSGLRMLKSDKYAENYAFVFGKTEKNDAILKQMDEFITELENDGTLKTLDNIWFGDDESKKKISTVISPDGPNGTLSLAARPLMEPFSYVKDNSVVGYDVDVITRFAAKYGYGLKIDTFSTSSAVIAAVTSGKYDFGCGCVTVTEERKESVNFAKPDYHGGVVTVVRGKDAAAASGKGFFASVSESFEKTFIREDRWKMVLSGLLTTLLIALLSAFFGTIFGFLLCLQRRGKNRFLSGLAAAFIRIIQGIPVLVLLMVLFYIVFASVSINGIVVAVIGFTINFGVYVSEMMRTGIDAVDIGQWEAADALGFGKVKAFVKIIGPQALRHTLPVYKGEFISMLKMTSVVGYIAIQDLTKATDIIRSRTYEAFFPLIMTAIIYFLLAWGLTVLLGMIEIKTDPEKRSRKLKGVVMSEQPAASEQAEASEKNEAQNDRREMIRIEHLKKVYPNVTPLKDVNGTICRGDVVTIIGPSGTGKSTLLRCLNRLEVPTEGKITVFGKDIGKKETDIGAVRQRMGMVFQNFNLFPHLTVIENIMLAPVELKGTERQAAYENAVRLLKSVGLAEKALSYPSELSGGQKQRVAIARTLAMDPEIVLFDEPTSALDPTMVGEVLSVIRSLAARGLTMMIVTHEMKFARDVSSRIFYMDEGIIYEEGTPEKIFDAPERRKTRAFIKRLKVEEIHITSQDYDFIGVNETIRLFGEKHMLAPKMIMNMQRVFEELMAQCTIPKLGQTFDLTTLIEYREENGELDMQFLWKGEQFNPFTGGDELSLKVVQTSLKKQEYSYENGENRLIITL